MKKEGVLCPSRRSAGKEEPLSSQELLYKDSRQKTNHIFTPCTNFSGLAPSVNSGAMLMRSSTCHPPPKPPPVKGHNLITGSRVEELQQRERERDTHLEPRCRELEKSVFHSCVLQVVEAIGNVIGHGEKAAQRERERERGHMSPSPLRELREHTGTAQV